jgi:hypothetical protein
MDPRYLCRLDCPLHEWPGRPGKQKTEIIICRSKESLCFIEVVCGHQGYFDSNCPLRSSALGPESDGLTQPRPGGEMGRFEGQAVLALCWCSTARAFLPRPACPALVQHHTPRHGLVIKPASKPWSRFASSGKLPSRRHTCRFRSQFRSGARRALVLHGRAGASIKGDDSQAMIPNYDRPQMGHLPAECNVGRWERGTMGGQRRRAEAIH